MYRLIKVGSDTELFLADSVGKPVPVCGLVGGTKENPLPVLGGDGFAVQEDNVMLEFNVPPASSAKEFANNMDKVLAFLVEEMRKKELRIVPLSYMLFDVAKLKDIPQAHKFGCDPDFNVWSRSVNPSTDSFSLAHRGETRRMAGLHVHVSYDVDGNEPSIEDKEWFVKAQDFFSGLGSVVLSPTRVDDAKRRNYYGRAGSFRFKPYGHEYRVLGSSLLTLGTSVFNWIFEQTEKAADHAGDANFQGFLGAYGPSIQQAINTVDVGMSQEIYKIARVMLPNLRADIEISGGL